MKDNKLKSPLMQSGAVIAGVIVLFLIVASSGASSAGGGIMAVIWGIIHTIGFVVGLGIGLAFCIAVMVGIFLAAVAMTAPEQASSMYADLKKGLTCTCRQS